VTNTSLNSARSTGPALFAGGWAIEQLWLFWLAPLAGAILGALDKWLVAESPQAQIARPTIPI
jgi:aquaporin Z